MMNSIINAVMADQLLMIAAILLILGPLVFLVAFIQFIRAGRKEHPVPSFDDHMAEESAPTSEPDITPQPYMQEAGEEAAPQPEHQIIPPRPMPPMDSDKTIVMPSGMGELQGQMEIAFSQIKTMSKKIAQFESELESLSRNTATKLETNELKEVPMNPADFTQKLLKLAEHVIVLEKEVARLKSEKPMPSNGAQKPVEAAVAPGPEESVSKPPIMPL